MVDHIGSHLCEEGEGAYSRNSTLSAEKALPVLPTTSFSHLMAPSQADYIVIGGGFRGCAVASRLHEGGSAAKVLLIEAGPDPTGDPRTSNPLGCFALGQSELDWTYKSTPQEHTNNRSHCNGAGKTLGGGSVLNYGGWCRGCAKDYDEWSRVAGDPGWSYEGMLPYFKKSEHHYDINADQQQHAFDGSTHFSSIFAIDPVRSYPLCDPVYSAWKELGVEHNTDPNDVSPLGYL